MTAGDGTTERFDAPIIGREADLSVVGALLADHAPLVTVTGRGCVGKTRLAREVLTAHRHRRRGPAGFVELTSLRDPDLVLPEIAARLGVPVPAGRSVLGTLAAGLAGEDLLLVLDNFEHVLPAAAVLGELLDRCPGLRVLVTSQAPLRLRAERIVRLDPLPVPAADDWAGANAAVRLYCERAAAADSSFRLSEHNAGAVAELCRRLEGLPLAIELAAVRSATLPAGELLARLDDIPFELLRGPRVDATPRHHDLRAAIAWTDGMLADADRRLLRALSVAAGPVTLDRAATFDGATVADTIERVTHLLDFRLIDRVVDSEPARYAVPWSIAEYGREALARSGLGEAVRRRYVEVMADSADLIGRGLRTDPARWMTVAVEDEAELLHAVDRAAEVGAWTDGLRLLPRWPRCGGVADIRRRSRRTSTGSSTRSKRTRSPRACTPRCSRGPRCWTCRASTRTGTTWHSHDSTVASSSRTGPAMPTRSSARCRRQSWLRSTPVTSPGRSPRWPRPDPCSGMRRTGVRASTRGTACSSA